MTPDLRAIQLFDEAIELAPRELSDFLNENCDGDDRLRSEIKSLIASYKQSDDMFPSVADQEISSVTLHHANPDQGDKYGMSRGKILADRYEVGGVLGAGGMGEVYRAFDKRLERDVALKILNQATRGSEQMKERFNRELKLVAALSHPNIVTLFDVVDDEGITYAVMELVEGKTVRECISDSLSWQEVTRIGLGAADGLRYAHARNLMHRDIKPENLIISSDANTKILDFGLARLEHSAADQRLTATSITPGTIPYMSPEQAEGGDLTCSTDIFSLGIVLYEMLCGINPFRADTAFKTMRKITEASPPSVSLQVPELPDSLASLIEAMLKKEPEKRPDGGAVFAELNALNQRVTGDTVAVATPDQPATTKATTQLPSTIVGDELVPSLLILPFKVVGQNDELEEVAEGLVEDLATILTRVPLLRHASRSSSHALKDSTINAADVRKSFGVTYMLEGSIKSFRGKVRANVQLTDTATGFQLWSHTFDHADDAELMTGLLHGILLRVEPQLVRAMFNDLEGDSSRHLLLEAVSILTLEGWSASSFGRAADILRKSIDLEPQLALAHAYLALVCGFGHRVGLLRDSEAVIEETIREAELAMKLDSMDSTILGLSGCAFADVGQTSRGIPILKRAIATDPNNSQALVALGAAFLTEGQIDEAIEQLSAGIQISPLDSRLSIWSSLLSIAFLQKEELDKAVEAARVGCEANDMVYMPRVVLSAAHLMRGDKRDAVSALNEAYRVKPDLAPHEIAGMVGRKLAVGLRRLRSEHAKSEDKKSVD